VGESVLPPSKYLTTELFLTAFCAMFLYVLREVFHSTHPSAKAERAILGTAPIAYYAVSLAILGEHSSALLIYLVLLAFIGVVVARRAGSWVRFGFWVAAAVPLLLWSETHDVPSWLLPGLAAWTAIWLLGLIGILDATISRGQPFGAADIALLHFTGLVVYAGAYFVLEPTVTRACAPLAASLALLYGSIGWRLAKKHRDEALHFGALACTLLTIATGLQFEGPWITSAWAAEGAVVVWLGLREHRVWLRVGGLVLFAIAIGRLLALQFSDPPFGQLVLFNERAACAAFVIALTYAITFVHGRYRIDENRQTTIGIGLVIPQLLILSTAAAEILAYWALHTPPPFAPPAQVIQAALLTGCVIVWLGLRRQQEWVRSIGAAVVAIAAISLFAIQLQPAPIGYVAVANARATAGALAVLVAYVLALLHRRLGHHLVELDVNLAILTTGASLLTLSLLTSEIDAFWTARGAADVWSTAREALQAIAWGGIGSLLVWRGLSNRRGWVRGIGGALLTIALLRVLRLQFTPAETDLVIANARALASLVLIGALYGLANVYRRVDVAEARFSPVTVLLMAANLLTLTLLTGEIMAYWQVRDLHDATLSASVTSHLAREMMLSMTWTAYAMVLIAVGLRRHYAPLRYFAITVFAITIVKVFGVDLAELDRLYRVMSVGGLGVALLLASYLYQRRLTGA